MTSDDAPLVSGCWVCLNNYCDLNVISFLEKFYANLEMFKSSMKTRNVIPLSVSVHIYQLLTFLCVNVRNKLQHDEMFLKTIYSVELFSK